MILSFLTWEGRLFAGADASCGLAKLLRLLSPSDGLPACVSVCSSLEIYMTGHVQRAGDGSTT